MPSPAGEGTLRFFCPQPAAGQQTMLSADNTPADPVGLAERQHTQSAEPTRHHSDIEPAAAASEQSPAGAESDVLSADSIPEQRLIGRPAKDTEQSAPPASGNPMLSADNTSTVQQAPPTGRTVMSATDLVLALGSTAEEQAVTLRAVLVCHPVGTARHGPARPGTARHGPTRPDTRGHRSDEDAR
ncbi:hypothetical protein [Kitasatospora sp. CB01950]|uniref:hypothetical protein n=1 Tax=Kitasatospora sp. CB01950 TaxID=1703930 RepID=UPI000939503D|nr:hypothetical protein [Kitasatospora sp. CB01950]OKI95097.1 hypothetical protein AMK19_33045 [Kitasatospora sp. CB01950]